MKFVFGQFTIFLRLQIYKAVAAIFWQSAIYVHPFFRTKFINYYLLHQIHNVSFISFDQRYQKLRPVSEMLFVLIKLVATKFKILMARNLRLPVVFTD